MNNYELHERAQELADTHSAYELAKRAIEAEDRLNSILPEPEWELVKFGEITGPAYAGNNRLRFQFFHVSDGRAVPSPPQHELFYRLAIGDLVRELDDIRKKQEGQAAFAPLPSIRIGASTTACDDQFAADPNGGEHG